MLAMVQDFHPDIQNTIGRIQSFEVTRDVIAALRAHGVASLNADILYGLPGQTRARMVESVQKLLSLTPDRVALYGYAHVPWMAKRQQMIDRFMTSPEVDACLPVRDRVAPGGRQPCLEGIADVNPGDFRVACELEQFTLRFLRGTAIEVTHDKDARSGAGDATGAAQQIDEARSVVLTHHARVFLVREGGEDGKHRAPAVARSHLPVIPRPEEEAADALVGRQRAPGEEGGDFGGEHTLEAVLRTEAHRRALIHDEKHGSLALFMEHLRMRFARARRDAPVDGPDVIAGLVAANLLELDTAATKIRTLPTGQLRQCPAATPHVQLSCGKAQGKQSPKVDLRALGRLRRIERCHFRVVSANAA